jgi:imidazole glycerol-phosphate synthase subunit HisH
MGGRVAVLDYGIGNLRSAEKALQRVGADARLTADPAQVAAADAVVLPGVGNFGRCMEALRSSGLEDVARDAVASGRPFLGICVGMQMLFDASEESPGTAGLGVLAGTVRWLPPTVKLPQIQWNALAVVRASALLGEVADGAWMYFVHSLHAVPADAGIVVATCDYGGPVTAAVERDNVAAVQFHPEKSARAGLALLAGWAAGIPTGRAAARWAS